MREARYTTGVYWVGLQSGSVTRVSLEGGPPETIYEDLTPPPTGFTWVHPTDDGIYWVAYDRLQRSDGPGRAATPLLQAPFRWIAFDASTAYWAEFETIKKVTLP